MDIDHQRTYPNLRIQLASPSQEWPTAGKAVCEQSQVFLILHIDPSPASAKCRLQSLLLFIYSNDAFDDLLSGTIHVQVCSYEW